MDYDVSGKVEGQETIPELIDSMNEIIGNDDKIKIIKVLKHLFLCVFY